MMKVAVISDIHANRHAFEATLDAVAASDAGELWCLGDLVGYGAEPDACVELARRHAAVCLAGNHDLAVTGDIPLGEFSRGASLAAQWTREVIDPQNLGFGATYSDSEEDVSVQGQLLPPDQAKGTVDFTVVFATIHGKLHCSGSATWSASFVSQ